MSFEEIRPEFEISSKVKSVDIHTFEGFPPLHHSGVVVPGFGIQDSGFGFRVLIFSASGFRFRILRFGFEVSRFGFQMGLDVGIRV